MFKSTYKVIIGDFSVKLGRAGKAEEKNMEALASGTTGYRMAAVVERTNCLSAIPGSRRRRTEMNLDCNVSSWCKRHTEIDEKELQQVEATD